MCYVTRSSKRTESLGDGNEKPSVRVSVGYEARRMTRVEIEQQTNAGVVRAHGD